MLKKKINVQVDYDLWQEAKKQDLNFSNFLQNSLSKKVIEGGKGYKLLRNHFEEKFCVCPFTEKQYLIEDMFALTLSEDFEREMNLEFQEEKKRFDGIVRFMSREALHTRIKDLPPFQNNNKLKESFKDNMQDVFLDFIRTVNDFNLKSSNSKNPIILMPMDDFIKEIVRDRIQKGGISEGV